MPTRAIAGQERVGACSAKHLAGSPPKSSAACSARSSRTACSRSPPSVSPRTIAPPPAHLFSEVIATAGLLLVIFSLARTKRLNVAPAAVGAYIGAAYFFTSSASFANPAISIGRMFSNTFAGIAPASVPGFIVAQLVGCICAILVLRILYPDVTPDEAAEVVLPHHTQQAGTDGAIRQPIGS